MTFMKLKICAFFIVFLCWSFVQNTYAQSIFDQWAELKDFHGVMSATFHPAEEGKLEPIKMRSREMEEKANTLAKSVIPAQFDTPAVKRAVKKLQKDSKVLNRMIKNKKASDSEITKSLSALHDVFHEIVGLCKNEKDKN
ncbi:MAG: hypothetical protein OHK0057_07100 [Thermoflexibacter sp.]